MKINTTIKWINPILLLLVLALPGAVFADDTQIYGSTNVVIQPNVLIIFDNSGSMGDSIAVTPDPYDPSTDYSAYGSYVKNTVYRSSSGSWSAYITNVSSLSTWCMTAYTPLTTAGSYTGHVQNSNGCGTTTRTTALGNYLNYLAGPGATSRPKLDIAKDVITTLIQNTDGVRFGLMVFGSTMDDRTEGGHIVKEVADMATGTNKQDLIDAVNAIDASTYTPLAETLYEAGLYFQGATSYFNQSSATYDSATDYSTYGTYTKNTVYRKVSGVWTSFIADVNTMTGCLTAKTALTTTGLYTNKRLSSNVATACPSSGTRYDFALGNYLNYLNSLGIVYTTPIQYSCQKNYIVYMTDGDPTQDDNSILASAVGDTDHDGEDPGGAHEITYSGGGTDWLDDVAFKWYNEDLLSSANVAGSGKQNIITYTIGFSTGSTVANTLLGKAATNGRGQFYAAESAQELTDAFLSALGQIVEDNTSFVAPVVPVSPQNKTYSGDYVYVGFFRPGVDAFWSGNLKKYAIVQGKIMGSDSPSAACVPPGKNDPPTIAFPPSGHCIPATNADGSFIEHSVYSYWSTVADGGSVEKGGVGDKLRLMTLLPSGFLSPLDGGYSAAANVRQIYTYLGGSDHRLAYTANQFEIANAAITPTTLGLTATDTTGKDNLIKYVHGQDSYNGLTNARDWILGDVLHSGPTIVSYDAGTISGHTARSVVYVGANDGMMHAFDDTTGRELWGYIPSNQLTHLKYLHGTLHPYFVDGSPKAYYLDNNNNGVIEATDSTGAHDKVILIFGERRGEGTAPSYHALDVTDPDNPVWLWDSKRGDSGLAELGQTWATPMIQKIKINVSGTPTVKNVFFVGGGYDPVNEDALPATSPDAATGKGRAVYAIDVETGASIWTYDYAGHASMTYAVPSDIAVIDKNEDGYTDLLYVGDMGGRMWRFDVSSLDVSSWSGRILFSANSGGGKRKILYAPDVMRDVGYYYVYFGTGDREHPLDITGGTGLSTTPCSEGAIGKCDRIYAVKDFDNSTASLTESNLTNVTRNELQGINTTQVTIDEIMGHLNALECVTDTTGCGWFIALTLNLGEKAVSSAVLFNKVVNISTFQPTSTAEDVDPCLADVGIGRVYQVDYKTGEAVFNYSVLNDASYDSATNARSKNTDTHTLLTRDTSLSGSTGDDRVQQVGSGLPSEVVIVIPESGNGTCDAMSLSGVGGGVVELSTNCGGSKWIYWRELIN